MHAFTVDLEDWHQMFRIRFTGAYGAPSPATITATHRLLDALDEAGVRATFFTVGVLAERYPDLVKEVHRRGHEIGSHTYSHRLIPSMTRDEFRADMVRSKAQLEELTGTAVCGFRAPEFSVTSLDHWCFEVLAELGFRYDSSVFPVRGVRYGIAEAPHEPFRIETPAGPLWEFPLATWEWRGRALPVAGGSYYRLWPKFLLRRAVDALAARDSAVFYFHPYEFHDGTLRLDDLGWRARLSVLHLKYRVLHNFRTARILRAIKPVLSRMAFAPLRDSAEELELRGSELRT